MEKKRMTTKEKLELMDQIKERNEQRRLEFLQQEKKARDKKAFDLYMQGEITKEELARLLQE